MDLELALTQLALAAGPYTFLTEGICQMIIKPILKFIKDKFSLVINPAHAALVVGVMLAAALSVDFASAIIEKTLGITITLPYIGMVISGLFIGRLSNFLHDIWPGNDDRNT